MDFRFGSSLLRTAARYPKLSTSLTPRTAARRHATTDSLPRVAQPSFWHLIIPRFIRERSLSPKGKAGVWAQKPWNPATFYIWMGLIIGSQAINLIALKNEHANYMRRADAKIALLKEVIDRVQKGEKLDVKAILGTGNEEKEREWEEVLKEIEAEDAVMRREEKKARRRLLRSLEKPEEATPVSESRTEAAAPDVEASEASKESPKAKRRPTFY